MNATEKKKLLKLYKGMSPEELSALKAKLEALVATPGDALPEDIQDAKDHLALISEIADLADLETSDDPEVSDASKQRESAILARMTESRGGLNRQQAEIAHDLQVENDKIKAAEAKAAKK